MTAPELKPCPFCGGEAHYLVVSDEGQRNDYDAIECRSCRASMSVLLHWMEKGGENLADLTAEWNRRSDLCIPRAEHEAGVAAAYEAAAWVAQHGPFEISTPYQIRALTPADASATLARMLAEAKAEGLREAAGAINRWVMNGGDLIAELRAILAAADALSPPHINLNSGRGE